MRLVVRQAKDVADQRGGVLNRTDEVSPMGSPLSMLSASTASRGGVGSGRGAGGGIDNDRALNTLAKVAAEIAKRGASAKMELAPGLGRSAFEHISVSPTIPVMSRCPKTSGGVVVVGDEKALRPPRVGRNNGSTVPKNRVTAKDNQGTRGSRTGVKKKLRMLDLSDSSLPSPVENDPSPSTSAGGRSAMSEKKVSGNRGVGRRLCSAKPHVLAVVASRPHPGDDSSSAASTTTTRSEVSLEAPSLTGAHLPGRIYHPVGHGHQQQVSGTSMAARGTPANNNNGNHSGQIFHHSHDARGASPSVQLPFRLSSSQRLTSFGSRVSSMSPVSSIDNQVTQDSMQKSAAAVGQWTTDAGASSNSRAAGGGVPRRPTMIDLLSTFGSQNSPTVEDPTLFLLKSIGSSCGSSSAQNNTGRFAVLSMTSQPEDRLDGVENSGSYQRKSLHRGSSSSSSQPGGSGTTRGRSSRGDRISQRHSRSSGGNGGALRRFSSGSPLPGVGSDDGRSSSRGRGRSSTKSRSAATFSEEVIY